VERTAAVAVRASTRADINGTIKRMLDVRKASFVPMDRAVEESSMEYGGITPIGLPENWRFVVDGSIDSDAWIVIGSGIRASKIAVPGSVLVALTGAEVIEGLGR
jgi:prolyl-tRNA editing enzyme YbaK/EbsC (Cys-tRNA(Pro) deacylase)